MVQARVPGNDYDAPPTHPLILASCAAACAILFTYFGSRYILGPLNVDEVYFSHTMWLTLQGKSQYIDFFSQHFPTYFQLYRFVLPAGEHADLDFIWIMRFSGLAILAGYIWLLFRLFPANAPCFLPLLLTFVVVSRMIEIRTDTLGLFFFNAAWAIILVRYSRVRLITGALLAVVATLFSARALVMDVAFAASLAYLAVSRRDWRALVQLTVLALLLTVIAAAAYFAAPRYFELLVQSSLIDPSRTLAPLSFGQRMLGFDRLPQVALTLAALVVAGAAQLKRKGVPRSRIVSIACLGQLCLILFDPSPFPYVYAWATVPVLAGLGLTRTVFGISEDRVSACLGIGFAFGIAALVIGYPLLKGRQPPPGSNYRFLLDAPIDAAELRRLSTRDVVSLMVRGTGQHSLPNQLAVRREVCTRFRGSVLSVWQTHPICMFDASYSWFSPMWPNIWSAAAPPAGHQQFTALLKRDPPDLFIYRLPGSNVRLAGWFARMLMDYRLDAEGFAVREQVSWGSNNSDRESIPPNSARN